jgi:hypothetical protein
MPRPYSGRTRKRSAQQADAAHHQRRDQQAEPEAAGERLEVHAEEGAHHEEGAVGEVHHRQHAEDQRQADGQQRIDRAERDAR